MPDSLVSESNIREVVTGGYCIGCGGCAVQDNTINLAQSPIGMPQAELTNNSRLDSVCPFGSDVSENEISRSLYADNGCFDERVGFYLSNYVGFVTESTYRESASSGGIVSWVLVELFRRGEIDGVIHVAEGQDDIFEYQVSETIGEITRKSKSRYYPVHYENALDKVLGNGKKYAFVGVPCYVKSIRLLARNNKSVNESIKYCIAIFCGHLKTKGFAEMIAMQQGVPANAIASVDFRVKNLKQPANRYSSQVFFKDSCGEIKSLPPVPTQDLYGLDWGLGYFKPKACDWCDDIAGETADLACGDAWLPEVVEDPLGTNVVITRNKLIDDILRKGRSEKLLSLTDVSVEKIYESQAGNYRHRREGLAVRLEDAARRGIWTPPKRIKAASYMVGNSRRRIYMLRALIAERSHFAFIKAKNKNSFLYFMLLMLPLELYYYFLNGRLFRGSAKFLYQLYRYLTRRNR